MFLLLLALPAGLAGTSADTFELDAGAWSGGVLGDGVLVVSDGETSLSLGDLDSLEARIRVRKVDAGSLGLVVGGLSWTASYEPDGGVSLGETTIPLPVGHWAWQTEDDPVLEPGTASWEAGSVLHCDVVFDEATATWFLYYTGAMSPGYGYRQIGVATSADGQTWTRYSGNPVLTVDYDLTAIDGVHVHMPTVVIDPADGQWHLFYACYQNDVGNRICHATSDDGLDWEPQGIALDHGSSGDFDSGSLREPDVQIGDDGTWHLFYNGTTPKQHYGPTGYATSPDGWTWTKQGAISTGESDLQGGGVLQTAYGVEQWFNCDDAFCAGRADPADWSTWERDDVPVLTKNWADWNSGYIQAPSPWLVGATTHLWFNAYDYGAGVEVLGHAHSEPVAGEWMMLTVAWDGADLSVSVDDGPTLSAALDAADGLAVWATGAAELDEASVHWEAAATGGDDTGPAGDGGGDGGGGADGGGETAADGGSPSDGGSVGNDPAEGSAPGSRGGCFGFAAVLPLPWLVVARRRRRSADPTTHQIDRTP